MEFKLALPSAANVADVLYPPRAYRHSWTHTELLGIFPDEGIDILDVGAGPAPFRARPHDRLVTVDFDEGVQANVVIDVSQKWPFAERSFDFIYMSHVVEHLYPQDRDELIRNVHRSLREGGLAFIRVPHRSSIQGTGWEHFTFYGLNGATSLSHGRNPNLPLFRAVSAGAAMSIDFYSRRSSARAVVERILNSKWRLTETTLCYIVGGIAEVQFLLQRMDSALETALREGGQQ
jgi:SAM-dependent methyltransferase